MNEKLKMKIEQLKIQAKKHGPVVLGVVGTIVASVIAVRYRDQAIMRQRVIDCQNFELDGWTTIDVPSGAMKEVENGAVLKYRQVPTVKGMYAQFTTLDEFPDVTEEINEK